MYGKCARDITHVPEMYLAETSQVNGSCPFNVPDTFPPVSRGPRPQCRLVKWLDFEEGPFDEGRLMGEDNNDVWEWDGNNVE